MQMSDHAQVRAKQRGIPNHYVDIILQYGTAIRRPGQAFEIQIRKKDKNRIIRELKRLINAVENSSKKALIVDRDMETVITLYNH